MNCTALPFKVNFFSVFIITLSIQMPVHLKIGIEPLKPCEKKTKYDKKEVRDTRNLSEEIKHCEHLMLEMFGGVGVAEF